MHPHSVLLKIKVYHITIRFDKDINLDLAGTYLQPHYGNGVFGNVNLSAEQH